ncbi:uncharacterized protein MKZ38_008822 [Zalerion maritima]|uniref:RBR-type E3 ubiquitin transferase n=1 Tax=Zalerion maritima TaxID=339359 RepID=A0AAD5RVL9_9PEZI|nr:uncharacterized protein MKZ38_008822 [Zalerion maritima]
MARLRLRTLIGRRQPVCEMAEPAVIYECMKKQPCDEEDPDDQATEDEGASSSSSSSRSRSSTSRPPPSQYAPTAANPSLAARSDASSVDDENNDEEGSAPSSQPLKPEVVREIRKELELPSFIPPAPRLPEDGIPGIPLPLSPMPLGTRVTAEHSQTAAARVAAYVAIPARGSSSDDHSTAEPDAADSSSITTKTTHNISIRSPSSTELTTRLSRLSRRVPRPTPVHIESIRIELGDKNVYDNFEEAVDAIRATEAIAESSSSDSNNKQAQAHVTVVVVGEGIWGSEVGSWVQESKAGDSSDNVNTGASIELGRPSTAEETREALRGRSSSMGNSGAGRGNHFLGTGLAHLDMLRMGLLTPVDPSISRRNRNSDNLLPQQDGKKDCMVCMTEQDEDMFAPPSSKCIHEGRTCKMCLAGWLRTNIDGGVSNQIICPDGGCGEVMEFIDIHNALPSCKPIKLEDGTTTKQVWKKYEKSALRHYLSTLDSFIWCLGAGCESGQIHDPAQGPIMSCVSCGFRTCAEHQIPWHEGDTCDSYDLKFSRARNDERLYKIAIKFLGMKKCPNCNVTIQKRGGCDHMHCSNCRAEFCFRCRADYEGMSGIWARGKSAHTFRCRHYWLRIPWLDWD